MTDIEGGAGRIDTTLQLNQTISRFESMPPGEGRLYRVSPVVLHGGRLLYDENAYGGQELTDDMIIENGATLTIFDEYVAKANIIVKNGSIVNGENGKIQFAPTKRLIVEGQCSISGSAGNKLNLEFEETTEENQSGIVIQEGGSLTIANCQVDDATIGINSLLNADYLNAQYIDFINCRDYTINIAGRSSGENPTPPSQIKYCTITGSDYGISILNLSEINIQENTITNTNWGIFLSSATNVSVIDNQINTNTDGVSGIYVNSSSGAIRGNSISGHEVGIYLANSSPDVGGNDITDCLYHGMYIGDGSIPNMQGRLVLNGGNHA
ncbi:MAG: right-handed parallel beta-helix repeat-containing protein [Ignavibacteriaceae bacterium]